ncbi:MAG: hypothetical protein GYA51_04725 [Candidatus Methanofastidiosa archaeon]|nr:hypothetical protein [Candidatus Methanofastidiosa archaeon]
MTYTVNINPTTETPTGHVDLFDGSKHMQFIVYNQNKKRDKTGIIRSPARQSPFVAVFSNIKYDDENAPYGTMLQKDWSGGRGQEDYEEDTTRYYDASGIDSITGDTGLILCGLPTFATGFHDVQENWGEDVTWRGLYGNSKYVSTKFTASKNWNTDSIQLYAWAKIRKIGSPTGSIYFQIYSDNDNKPNSVLLTSSPIPHSYFNDILGKTVLFITETNVDLAASTNYHVVICTNNDGTTSDHFEIACDVEGTSCISANGTEWTSNTGYAPYYRFYSDQDVPFIAHFFEYKGALYCATEPDDGSAGKLYINGWRGACDSNSGNLHYTNDATAPGFANDELVGNIIKIIQGSGSNEYQNWRSIVANTTTSIEVSQLWNIPQDTGSDYVIIGNNKWNNISTAKITTPITDVAVVNNIVYLAQYPIIKFMGKNNNGTWTNLFESTYAVGDLLKVVYDPDSGPILWIAYKSLSYDYRSKLNEVIAPLGWSTNELLSGTLIDDCSSAWNEQTVTGVTNKFEYGNVIFEITNTFSTGIIGSKALSNTIDLRPFNYIHLKIMSTIDLGAGTLELLFDDSVNCASPVLTVSLPALRANVWNDIDLPISPSELVGANSIISIGLNCTEDKNTNFNIWLDDGVWALYDYSPISLDNRINAIETYGSPQKLWVITEDEIGYIDNHKYVPSEIKGLKPLASNVNGRAHVADDVYLYFNIGNDMHRFYSQSLYNISAYKDAGMPEDRIASPSCAIAYKDRVYVAYDGGYSNYSYILCYHGDGWHEVYRAPINGLRIRSIYIQPIPDNNNNIDRLWINMGCDVLWIPVSSNPYNEPNYKYIDEGYLETPWIYGSRRDIKKYFKELKLFCENVSSNNYYIQADYKLDDDSGWTTIDNNFDSIEEGIDFSSSSPPTSVGKRLKIRFRFYTNDCTKTPRLKQMLIRGIGYAPQKFQYSFYFKMQEGDYNEDLEGDIDTTYDSVDEQLEQLDTWAKEITPLLMRTSQTPFDNKIVFVLPGSCRGEYLDTEEKLGSGREAYYGFVTLLEA